MIECTEMARKVVDRQNRDGWGPAGLKFEMQVLPLTEEGLPRLARCLANAFKDMPFNDWYIREEQHMAETEPLTDDVLIKSFTEAGHYWLRKKHYYCVEVNDYAAVAILCTKRQDYARDDPDYHPFTEAVNNDYRRLGVFESAYNMSIIARDPEAADAKGCIRALVEYLQAIATRDGRPLMLEAINDHARSVYRHLGWKDCHTSYMGPNLPYHVMRWDPPTSPSRLSTGEGSI